MALTINTNLSSLIVQKNLSSATSLLNSSIERMSTGYKINHASDNAASYSISTRWDTQLGSLEVAAENAAMGADMLKTCEENYALISSHLQRVRDLTEQAANGTYATSSLNAIKSEITARLEEVDRIAANAEFNGIKLMNAGGALTLQVGLDASDNSKIVLAAELFAKADTTTLCGSAAAAFATECTTASTAATKLAKIDEALDTIATRVTTIGSAQNRVESAITSISVQSENLMSSRSTIKDSDVATESSNYIRAQILQQASATLLSTANQMPSIALSLI